VSNLRTRTKKVESAVGGSDYIGFQELLTAVLSDDPVRRNKARKAMKGKKLDPKTEALLIEIANMPPREAVTVSTH